MADFVTGGFNAIIIDGLMLTDSNLGNGVINHGKDAPFVSLSLPGRMLFVGEFGGPKPDSYAYNHIHFPVDSWVALFAAKDVSELFAEEPEFASAIARSLATLVMDQCELAGIVRANYAYYGVLHLMKKLLTYRLFITQQQVADLMGLGRSTISKAFARLKQEEPELYSAYHANKGRKVQTEGA